MINLSDLARTCEKACSEAVQIRKVIKGAINWADLHCHAAESWTDNHGATGHRVMIEEASPDNHDLQIFIANYLADEGFPDIEVITEW